MSEYNAESPLESEIIFSLIMATYNRKKDVENFIISLLTQSFDLHKVESTIVDQNKHGLLFPSYLKKIYS